MDRLDLGTEAFVRTAVINRLSTPTAPMLKPQDFRRLALELPEVTEEEHQGHPDFRVGGKVFATLGGGAEWGMIRIPAELQAQLIDAHPQVFEASPGAWGKQGCTKMYLKAASVAMARDGMLAAWRARAPKRMLASYDAGEL